MPQIIIRGLVEGLCIGIGEVLVKKAVEKYQAVKEGKAAVSDLEDFITSIWGGKETEIIEVEQV